MNVSGIVVKVLPQHLQSVIEQLKKIPHVDYHFHDELGNIIITIEEENVSKEIAVLYKIEEMEHVISAEMSYTYAEEELDKERDLILNQEDPVPGILKDDTIDARDIKYQGSVGNLMPERKGKKGQK